MRLNVGSFGATVVPPLNCQMSPRKRKSPPSVTTKDGISRYAMRKPWNAPIAIPRRMPRPRARTQSKGALTPIVAGKMSAMRMA